MKYSAIIFLFFVFTKSVSQHDFDSLYKANSIFQSEIDTSFLNKGFYDDGQPILNVTITSNFKYLYKKKYKAEYQPATLTTSVNDTVQVTRDIQVKARGALRKSICYFPPLKLNFKKKEMLHEDLKEFDKIKLVRNCRGGQSYDEYVLLEYLIYKMYNVLTDYSFKARLLNVVYVDTGKKKRKSVNQYSFMIEPLKLLAHRTDCVPIEQIGLGGKLMKPKEENIMALFQYMIGNTDWQIQSQHNMKIIKSTDFTQHLPIAVPYDFDYTGFVDAPYAVPSDKLPIDKVTERLYMGSCSNQGLTDETVKLFLEKKSEVYELVETFDLISDRTKERSIAYLDEFYDIISSKNRLKVNITDRCKK